MQTITVRGHSFKSVKEGCRFFHLSYQRLSRLIRHYQRARDDNALAFAWALGDARFNPRDEPVTEERKHDLHLMRIRKLRQIERQEHQFRDYFDIVDRNAS